MTKVKMVAESLSEYKSPINKKQGELNEGLVKQLKKLDTGNEEKVRKFAYKAMIGGGRTAGKTNVSSIKKMIKELDLKKLLEPLKKAAADKFHGRFFPYKGGIAYKKGEDLNLESQAPAGPTGDKGTSGM